MCSPAYPTIKSAGVANIDVEVSRADNSSSPSSTGLEVEGTLSRNLEGAERSRCTELRELVAVHSCSGQTGVVVIWLLKEELSNKS